MDVTCDRCSTEYEFEEALVSPRGTTVKCTQCGHLFKVFRPERALPTLANHWTVRGSDGSSHQLPNLVELTQSIALGIFLRDDEVSRTGKAWRRLGDIEELEAFFAEADRRGPSRRRQATQNAAVGSVAPAHNGTESPSEFKLGRTSVSRAGARTGVSPARASSSEPLQPQPLAAGDDGEDEISTEQRELPETAPAAFGGRAETATDAPQSDGMPLQPSAADSDVDMPLAAADAGGTDETAAEARITAPFRPIAPQATGSSSKVTREPAGSRGGWPASPPIDLPRTAAGAALAGSTDRALQFETRQRRGWWIFALGIVAAGVGLASFLYWPTRQPAPHPSARPTDDPSSQYLVRADASLATHRSEHFEQAITDYIKALAFHESDAHVLSALSRVYAVWAQELNFSVEAQKDLPDSDVEGRSQRMAADVQAQKLAEQAKSYAEMAARKNPGNTEAEVALSDALRLTGNLVSARSELDRARASDHNPSAETLRVAALLAIAEADGDARAGVQMASQAVAQDPDMLRAQLLLARCLAADGDMQGAHYHLHAVTTRDRDLPSAFAIDALIARAEESAAKSAPPPSIEPTKNNPDAAAAQFDSLSHDGYIERGQTFLEGKQIVAAKHMFEQALVIRPNSPQAHVGLGYVALEKGRPQLAAEHFTAASRSGYDEALVGLAEAFRRLGRPRDAVRAYQNYIVRNPHGAQLGSARAQVDRIAEELQNARKSLQSPTTPRRESQGAKAEGQP
jgi:predicted Zn finger-like uncharacterized protein